MSMYRRKTIRRINEEEERKKQTNKQTNKKESGVKSGVLVRK